MGGEPIDGCARYIWCETERESILAKAQKGRWKKTTRTVLPFQKAQLLPDDTRDSRHTAAPKDSRVFARSAALMMMTNDHYPTLVCCDCLWTLCFYLIELMLAC